MQKVFVAYDSKSEAYGQPWYAMSTGAAIRSFSDEVNRTDGQSQVAVHPEDFILFEIGTYNELEGRLEIYEAKKSLGLGLDFLRESKEPISIVKKA